MLMKVHQSSTFQGKKVTTDEIMTPSIQDSIILDWLAGIDEDLVNEVELYYARDLENVSLVENLRKKITFFISRIQKCVLKWSY